MRWLRRKQRSALGPAGEAATARYLWWRGYQILGRNVQVGAYEIDLIVRRGPITAFVEVKTRLDTAYGAPAQNVDARKQQHLRIAARMYMKAEPAPTAQYRFDVASVILPERGKPVITYYENAFPDA